MFDSGKKSTVITYFLWLIGGVFGLHHIYLGRDAQAFIWWCTLGGYIGCGWVRDLFYIPKYVADVNEDETFVRKHVEMLRTHEKPPFSTTRFSGMVVVSYLWACVCNFAIPLEPVAGINWYWLNFFVPIACALGVWTVGNIGREEGGLKWPLIGAFVSFPIFYWMDDLSLMSIVSAWAFDSKEKRWRRKPTKKRSFARRMMVLTACALLYLSLWSSYIYFNARLTDSEGEEIPVHEAIHHFFTSPWWTDLQQSLIDTWNFAQHHGWGETWRQMVDLSDPHGEQNAYKVLGLTSSASQSEITAKWRSLSRQFHPDKVKDSSRQREAQEKFMEIQQAYDILSNIKSKRNQRNQKYSPD